MTINRINGHVWDTASKFARAADILWDSSVNEFCVPVIMNYAFACELALKSCDWRREYNTEAMLGLISTARIVPNSYGHDLAKLFSKLPTETQSTLADEFRRVTDADLAQLLEACRDVFVNIRYHFETKPRSFPLSELRELANGLIKSVYNVGMQESVR